MIFFGLVIGSSYFEQQKGPIPWLILITNVFIWPHIGYWLGRRSKNPMAFERLLMYADSILAGQYIAQIGFSLWPSVAALGGNAVSNAIGMGMRVQLKGALLSAITAALITVLLDFYLHWSSGLAATITSIIFIFTYLAITARQAHLTMLSLRDSARQLTAKNRRIQELLTEAQGARKESEAARAESERLLHSILPVQVAEELKRAGRVEPLYYDAVSVIFTDFVGFTQASRNMLPDQLVEELDGCFSQFDAVVKLRGLEKLKTIGDAYMCAAGLPAISQTHAIDACLVALEFRQFMMRIAEIKSSLGAEFWRLRIGLHSGPVTAGVIGTDKFAYDIWGDTVNTASRMESSGEAGKVNLSQDTYLLVKDFFDCEYRGQVEAKGSGKIDMYFLNRVKAELSGDPEGLSPNSRFDAMRSKLEQGYVQ